MLPNKETITATHKGSLPMFANLSKNETDAFVYPKLTNESLLSIGQLCDDGCLAIFSERHLHVLKNKKVIIEGDRNLKDGLWDVNLSSTTSTTTDEQLPQKLRPIDNKSKYTCAINYLVQKDKTKLELAQYLHACAFSPSVKTLQACIRRGNFISWPGIEDLNFNSMLGTTMAPAKGHLNQERKNV